ncbi:MAG TPA: glucoamylase [Spartobacteria bacterium]|nr:glucoamylase [Spartobacteria bacterium]
MMITSNRNAPGAPGIEPRWTSSAKDGIGTAYHTSSCLWFTLSHGIINEIYFPHVDSPNTRDLQFLITDGETFCHEEKRDLDHLTEYPEQNALLYRLTNSDREGRYRIVKEIIGEPHSSVLLIHTRLEILEPKLRGKLRLYALLAPHMKGTGYHNRAKRCGLGDRKFLEAQREEICMVFGCEPDFTRRSVGYVGHSDGWQDLMNNFKMDWEFEQAQDGNIALTAEIDLSRGMEFTLGVAFGHSMQSASTQLLQALAIPFSQQREKYISQWQRTRLEDDFREHSKDGGSLFRLSQCILLAHEDKMFQGAFVASLSIPWGETNDDSDAGGYHLVWTRDLVHTATAMLAGGQTESALHALIWLACVQAADGNLPQNSWINGTAYWKNTQLDEVAVPILLAWRLHRADALRQFDPWPLVSRAARFLMAHGPVTAQERWEEISGYSPSTLAAIIAALVCAAEFARHRKKNLAADFLLDYADWLSAHLEEWTVTNRGELVKDKPRHYVRITPADLQQAEATADPDTAVIEIANGGGKHLARNIVSGDFLQLVRLGVRAADDPLMVDSLVVIDQELKRDLPQGPCWRRYNYDGYGQKADGSAFDGTGEGRSWPILTGERGHYELAAGRDPMPFISAMEKFANEGGMLSEQLWDAEDLPEGGMRRGLPTGAAMPLCWSHAEYVSLVRSAHDGICFDRVEPAFQRYVVNPGRSRYEIWSFRHQLRRMSHGRILRIIVAAGATIVWSANDWASTNRADMTNNSALNLWFADLPTENCPGGLVIEFTFFWKEVQRWEGRNYSVAVSGPK